MSHRITPLRGIRNVNYLEFEFHLQVSGRYFVNRINGQVSFNKRKSSCIEASLVAHAGETVTPCSGKVSHTAKRLSLWATATKPVLQSPGAASTEPAATASEALAPRACAPKSDKPSKQEAHWLQTWEGTAHHSWRRALTATRPSTVKNI